MGIKAKIAGHTGSRHSGALILLCIGSALFVYKFQDKLKFAPIRLNILIIATLIFLVCVAIALLIGKAIMQSNGDDSTTAFVIGALIGLLGSGITGLAGLGTTLVNEANSSGTGNGIPHKCDCGNPKEV